MIYGLGVDLTDVRRFEKWVGNPDMISRFFNSSELSSGKSKSALCQHYAARFAAKEAFSKALGTGLCGFELKDVFVKNDEFGKPELCFCGTAEKLLKSKFGECKVHVSLTHEKEYAAAFVVIEK